MAQKHYQWLRKNADAYRKSLVDYETPLLKKGLHPDTGPNFWSGYKEPEFPGREPKWAIPQDSSEGFWDWAGFVLGVIVVIVVTLGLVTLFAIVIRGLVRVVRKEQPF